jgi:cytosine/adenosine deaminase-related metal-dependent hydrolase
MSYKAILPSLICVCDNDFTIIKNKAIVFDENIIDIDSLENIQKKYKLSEIIKTNDILMPSFTNPHIHLEFLANINTLEYGSFTKWLYSVIKNRDNLIKKLNDNLLKNSIQDMINYGTTNIGAISSMGLEAKILSKSKMNVVLFNEILGISLDMIDYNFDLFKKRFEDNSQYENKNFSNNIAIHSPYSIHPQLIEKALSLETKKPVSAHFMESVDERQWMDSSKGALKGFFKDFFSMDKNIMSSSDFLDFFKSRHTIFVHGNYMNKKEINILSLKDKFIINCPKSNKLLGSKKLNLSKFNNFNLGIGTDGLSSNTSINIIDELKYALFIHEGKNIIKIAKQLLISATNINAKSLKLNSGTIEKNKEANFLLINNIYNQKSNLPMDIILHIKKPNQVYSKGKKINS